MNATKVKTEQREARKKKHSDMQGRACTLQKLATTDINCLVGRIDTLYHL